MNCKKTTGQKKQWEEPMTGNWHRGKYITGRTQGNDMEGVSKSCPLSWPSTTIWLKSCFLIKLLLPPPPLGSSSPQWIQFRSLPNTGQTFLVSILSSHTRLLCTHTIQGFEVFFAPNMTAILWSTKDTLTHSSKLRSLCVSQNSLVWGCVAGELLAFPHWGLWTRGCRVHDLCGQSQRCWLRKF